MGGAAFSPTCKTGGNQWHDYAYMKVPFHHMSSHYTSKLMQRCHPATPLSHHITPRSCLGFRAVRNMPFVVRGNGDSLMFGLPIRQTIDLMNDCVAHERSVDRPPAPVCQVYHKVGNATAPFTINGASKYVIQLLQYKAGYAKQKYLGCSRISSLLILTCQETFPVHTS